MLFRILEEAKIKNSVLRGKCSQYLECILKSYSTTILEKFTEDIEEMLTGLLNEAAAETRTTARECYLAYRNIFPDQAKNLLKQLPPATQKAILEQSNKTNAPESNLATPEKFKVKSPHNYGSERVKSDFMTTCNAISHKKKQINRTAFSSSKSIPNEVTVGLKKNLLKKSKGQESEQSIDESIKSVEDKSTPGSALTEESKITPENSQEMSYKNSTEDITYSVLIEKSYSEVSLNKCI